MDGLWLAIGKLGARRFMDHPNRNETGFAISSLANIA